MPSTVPPRFDSGAAVRLRRLGLVALAATALVTCTEEPTSPNRPGVGTIRVGPQFDAFARMVPLTLDNVRVIVVRPPSDVILTATRSFNPSNPQLTLSLPVLLRSTSEALQVTLELYAGTTLLFSGTSTVQVAAGGTTPPASVPVNYQGPGATLATLTLAPRDTTVSLGASFPFTATALDAQQANVPQFYVSWSADNGSIDAAGVFTAPGTRDTLFVHAAAPNGVQDSTRVFVTAAPSSLTKVGGDGQSGSVGGRLGQLLAVEVNGSDGLPVAGAAVAFTVTTGGGSVDSATATSDAQGIARTGAVLGLTVGQQTFTATVSGIPAAVFTATATGVAPIVVTLDAGSNTSCEIRGTQTLCWGENASGQLGDGGTTDRAVPGPISGSFTFTSLAVGSTHACALTAAGQAFCWGDNSQGTLGDGTLTDRLTPTAVTGGQQFVQLAAGDDFNCALTAGGQAFCWGVNTLGQLGDGSSTDRTVPTAVTGGNTFMAITAGSSHACGLTAAGIASCWGWNLDGQLGDGSQTDRTAPTAVTGGLTFSAISAGFNSTCALDTAGSGFCWGNNFGIQLTSPQPVAGGFTYTALDMGDFHVCGLSSGGWRCGGDNGSGQLGDGSTTDRVSPVIPSGGFTFTALAGGAQHTCGRTATGTLCWGSNSVGQLGDGTNNDQLTPTLSVGPATTAAVSTGNGQTATAGTAVPIAPAILVQDALNNPVPGVDVIFAVTSGGGSVTGAVTQTDALGIATVGSWTLGATPGSNTLSATAQVGGVGGNPVSFTATGAAASLLTWNGSVSTAWATAANWTPATVPTSALDVLIPSGTPNQPTATTTANTRSMIVQAGAVLTLSGSFTFNVFGDFDNSGTITLASGTPTIDLRGTTRTMQGNSPAITSVSGSYTLIGSVTVANSFSISGGTSGLTVGGQLLSVSSLSVGSGGSLFMTNAADNVVVSGNLTMGGGDHFGRLTAGQIQVQGNFLQSSGGSVNSYAASGTHTTVMTGVASVTFQSPGVAASHFQHLNINSNPVTLLSRAVASGNTAMTGGLVLNGRTLEVLGNFTISNAGSRLTMTNPLDSLLVGGNATFGGGNQLTFMSAGVLTVGGDLTQLAANSGDAFHPSGTHKTVLTGSGQILNFATPGDVPGTSHFQLVDWSGTGTLFLASDVFAHGTFQSLGAGASTLSSINHVLDVGGFSAAGPLTFNGTQLRLNMPSGGPLALSNFTFQNMSSTLNQLEVLHPGTGGPFSFTTLTFLSVPSSGHYLVVTDTDGAAPDALTVNMVSPSPATDGGFSQALNGAVINWPASAPIKTWLGNTQDWHTTTNWSPAGLPTATDDVTIPVTANQPILSADAVARTVTINSGVLVNLNSFDLDVHGDLIALASPSFISGGGTLQLLGTARTVQGSLGSAQQVTVQGSYSLSGTTAMQDLNILGTGTLTVNGQTLTMQNAMFISGAGARLIMTNPADLVSVATSAFFDGATSTGSLTAGVLQVGANFTVGASFSSFAFDPSLTHRVVLTTPSITQSVAFSTIGSHFQDLQLVPSGGMSMVSSVNVTGQLITTGGLAQAPAVSGVTTTLTVAGVDVDGLAVNQARLTIGSGTITRFQNVVFSGQVSTITQLTVNHPGGPTPFSFTNVSFASTPTTGGFYLSATDSDGLAPALVIDMVNPSPASDGGFSQGLGGAVINWPASVPIKTWTGGTQDWHTNSNWSPAGVPTASDDVTIPVTANQPILSAPAAVRDLTVQSGVLLNLNGFTLDVHGNLSAPAATSFVGGGGLLQLQGAGKTIGGNLSTALVTNVIGTYSLSARTVLGNLTLSSSAGLAMAGHTLVVGAALNTTGSATITMNNPLDSVLVTGAGIFGGGDETGKLTAGYLKIGGSFNQTSGTSTSSFTATRPHKTELGSAAVRVVTFANPGNPIFTPGTSHFGDLDVSTATGGLTLNSNVFGLGELTSLPPGAAPTVSGGATKRLFEFDGLRVNGLVLDNAEVVTFGALAIAQFDNVTIQNITTGNALAINDPGRLSPYVFNNISFTTVPAGNYILANDNAADASTLTIEMINPNPATPSGKVLSVGGAVINWPATAPAAFWTGTVSADWHTPGNWSTGSVPTAANDVTIGSGTPNAPVLSASAVVGALSVQSTATLDLGGFTLTVNGLLDVLGASVTGAAGSRIVMTGTSVGMQGSASVDLTISGSATLFNTFTLGGSLLLQGSLNLNGASLFISGDLTTQGASALIVMQNGGEGLHVAGNATFDGGNQLGSMSTGALLLGGNFTQLATHSGDSYHPSGAHLTLFTGVSPTISFATPGDTPGSSHFQEVSWTGGTMTLLTDVYAHGIFGEATAISGNIASSNGRTLHAGGFSSINTLFNNVQLVLHQASATIIDLQNVIFQAMDPTAVALTTEHNGVPTATPLTYTNITFSTVPTTGLYLRVTDLASDGNPLIVDMVNPSPTDPGSFVQALNGAVVNWPVGGPVIVWNGSVDTDWFDPANWTGGVLPSPTDNVLIPSSAANFPDAPNIAMNDLTVQSGASLTTSDHTITVGGDLDASGTITGCCQISMTGTGVSARGNLDGYTFQVTPGAVVSLNGTLFVGGQFNDRVEIDGGELIINGQLLIATQLSTFDNGLLTMTTAADQVLVQTADFAGGDETGRLTAGNFITDDFTQSVGTSGDVASYIASATHVTTIGGGATGTVSFATPGSSQFGSVNMAGGGTSVMLNTSVIAAGQLIAAGGVSIVPGSAGVTLTASGAGVDGLILDGVPLVLNVTGGSLALFDNVTFQNMDTLATQLTVNHPGPGSPFVFNNLIFSTTPSGGFHISVADLNSGDGTDLVVEMVNPTPNGANAVIKTDGIASVIWP